MKTRVKSTLAGAVALLMAAALTPANASAKSVTVKGEYAIDNGDQAGARKAALKDAFRKAVEQVGGVKVQSTTISKEWEIVKDEITAKAEGMVTSHKILAEGPKDGVYELTMQAEVDEKPLGEAIAQLISIKNGSKTAFLIAEKMAGNTDFAVGGSERGKTENLLVEIFQERGFPVVDLGGLAGIDLSSGANKGEISAADAEKVAKKANAQYVVFGKVEGRDAGSVMGSAFHSYQISITLKMLALSNHEVVATATEAGAVPSLSANFGTPQSLKDYRAKIVDKVAKNLMEKIARRWTEEEQTGSKRVQLVVQGLKNFKEFASFNDAIGKMKGVSKTNRRDLADGEGTIDVEMETSADALASALSDAKVGNFKVDVTSSSEGRIVVTVKK